MFQNLKQYLSLNDDEDFIDEYEEKQHDKFESEARANAFLEKPETGAGKAKVLSLVSSNPSRGETMPKVVLVEPRSYQEVQDIADHLKGRKAVIINLQRMPKDQAKRVVDFLSGTVYAINGDIQKLGLQTFICTPDNVDVSGTITDYIQETDQMDKRW